MKSGHDKNRMNVEGDRLSNLSDDFIHKILSFIDITQAIKMSALSSRWRYIWTSLPHLSFSSEEFHTLLEFSDFVTQVLSSRNTQIEVSSVKLTFYKFSFNKACSRGIVEQILNYVFSHNVQELNITNMHGDMKFPISLFSSKSLKHFTLCGYSYRHSIVTPSTWELPALTTLNLELVAFYDDDTNKCAGLFSNCVNLKNLTLKHCTLKGASNGFNICHPGLSSLTLDHGEKGVNVVTPQLKNLTICNWRKIHLISAPNLSSLHYKDCDYEYDYNEDQDDYGNYGCDCDHDHGHDDSYDADPLQLSTQLSHLEMVDICIDRHFENKAYKHKLFLMLQKLQSVKFFTLNLELVNLLFYCTELVSHQPSLFVNVEFLKIHPHNVTPEEYNQPKVTLAPEIKNYLLDSSPSATLTIVSHEEIRALKNVTLARNLIEELQRLLEEWKDNNETNTANMKQEKAPMYNQMATMHEQVEDTKMKWHYGERVTHVKSYWEDLNNQRVKGRIFTDRVIPLLQRIETAFTRMPTSYQAKLKARFSTLSAEADTMMDKMMDRMKIQYGKKPSRPNV